MKMCGLKFVSSVNTKRRMRRNSVTDTTMSDLKWSILRLRYCKLNVVTVKKFPISTRISLCYDISSSFTTEVLFLYLLVWLFASRLLQVIRRIFGKWYAVTRNNLLDCEGDLAEPTRRRIHSISMHYNPPYVASQRATGVVNWITLADSSS